MRFAFTEEQEQLRAVLRDLLDARSPSAGVRAAMAAPEGFDRSLWRELTEMGIVGMAVPESLGGLGFGFVEQAVALEEAGRVLLPSPLLGTSVLAGGAVLPAEDSQRAAQILPGIPGGTTNAAGRPPPPAPPPPTSQTRADATCRQRAHRVPRAEGEAALSCTTLRPTKRPTAAGAGTTSPPTPRSKKQSAKSPKIATQSNGIIIKRL